MAVYTKPQISHDEDERLVRVFLKDEMGSVPFPTSLTQPMLAEMITTFLKTSVSCDSIEHYGLRIRNFTFPPSTKVS